LESDVSFNEQEFYIVYPVVILNLKQIIRFPSNTTTLFYLEK